MTTVRNIDALRKRKGTIGASVQLLGKSSAFDGGFNFYAWDDSSTLNDDGRDVLKVTGVETGRWKKMQKESITPYLFGAKGDAETDDTQAFRDCVAFAILKGFDVVLPKGNFVLNLGNNPIVCNVPTGKTLRILGETGNLINFTSTSKYSGVFLTSTNWNIQNNTYNFGKIIVDGVNFTGVRNEAFDPNNPTIYYRAIWLDKCERVEVKNCTFEDIKGWALCASMTKSGEFRNNTFRRCYAREVISDATGDAMGILAFTKNFSIANNFAELETGQSGRCGISVDDQSENVTVIGNTIIGYERGIHVERCKKLIVTNNVVRRSPIAGLSSQNERVIWVNNYFDGKDPVYTSTLAAPAVFFAYLDNNVIYKGNVVENWHEIAGTYLAKFWGTNLTIDSNTFTPNTTSTNTPLVLGGFADNEGNKYTNNIFEGKTFLVLDNTKKNVAIGNQFFGGGIVAQNSTMPFVKSNTLKPRNGDLTGRGITLYGATNPICQYNEIFDSVDFAFDNSNTTDAVFDGNILYRTVLQGVGNLNFYTNQNITPQGKRKNAVPNFVRDYVANETYKIGHDLVGGIHYNYLINEFDSKVGIGTRFPTARLHVHDGGIRSTGDGSGIIIDKKAANSETGIFFSQAALSRWFIYPTGDANSDLLISRYDDAGNFVDTVLKIVRATGRIQVTSLFFAPTTGPSVPWNGDVRYNATTGKFEGYTGGVWVQFHDNRTESIILGRRIDGNGSLLIDDIGKQLEINSATAATFTVPNTSTIPFETGFNFSIVQWGAGQVTFTPAAGVNLRSEGGRLKTNAQYSCVSFRMVSANEWIVTGSTTT